MIVHGISSELWWLANVDEIRSPRPFSIHDVFRSFADEFHFIGTPKSVSSESYTFEQGEFLSEQRKVPITQLVLYNASVHVSVLGESDGVDAVFQKLKQIFQSFGMREPSTPPVSFYRSTIVCDFDKASEPLFGKLEALTALLQKPFPPAVKIGASGIAFVADPETLPRAIAPYNPTLFSINRKTDVEFAKNRCTCFANLKTGEHLAVLAEIERLL